MKTIGIDLGGTKGFFGVVQEDGSILDVHKIASPHSWEDMKKEVAELTATYQSKYDDIVAVGFGIPGLIGTDGVAYHSPNFRSLNRVVAVRDEISEVLNVPVYVDNDNNCAGYAEARFGAAKESQVAICVGLGTGIGGALLIGGEVFHGAHGFAGDFGHSTIDINGPLCACGKRGCFEAIASGSALGRIGREYATRNMLPAVVQEAGGNIDDIEGIHVGKVAQSGKEEALVVMDEYAHNVARGLASLTESFDPDRIVITGGVVELGNILFAPLLKHFLDETQGDDRRPRPRIVPAHFGEKAGVIGAGAMAAAQLH